MRQGQICVCTSPFLRLLVYTRTSFFFRAGPGTLHEFAVSAFSLRPLARTKTLVFILVSSLDPVYLCVSPLPPYFLARAFSFFLSLVLLLSCTWPNVTMGSIPSWFPPVSFHVFSTTLSHRPFVTFSHTDIYRYIQIYTDIYRYGWQPRFLACSLHTAVLPFQTSRVSICNNSVRGGV